METQITLSPGKLNESLHDLESEIRKKPADGSLRIYLFQLLSILGQWERALNQLKVIEGMETHKPFAHVFKPLVQCELLRGRIFAGQTTPLVFGEPQEWIGLMVKALQEECQGNARLAAHIRSTALEQSPAIPGRVGDEGFAWLSDADSRLGPVLEACIEKKYYWVPLTAVRTLRLHAPADLRDLIWAPAEFTWTHNGHSKGHLFVRYPGTDQAADDALKLARLTNWQERDEAQFHGLGQKILNTDRSEYPLLEIRQLELTHA